MAKSNYNNSVPLGREGTGAAQILGPNRALGYFLNENAREKDRLLREQQQYQQRQQGYNNEFQKNIIQLNELANTPMYQNEFNELTQGLARQGAELMSKGINPYNPNQSQQSREAVLQWQGEVNKVRNAKVMVDNLYKERQDAVKKYNSNPDKFDFEEFSKLKEFEKNNTLEDILSGGVQMPALSEIYNLGEGAVKQFGEMFKDSNQYITDEETGQPMLAEIREADIPRIQNATNTFFADGSPAANEVNRRLRKEFGKDASISGLLGTLDKDELRSIIDNELRNDTTDYNPMVELMSRGKVPAFDTPEYDRFLNEAVNEQLRAERILDDAKQQVANTLVGRVNTKDKRKFDFTLKNQKLKEQAAAETSRNKAATYRNTMLSIQKKLSGSDDGDNDLIDQAVDIDYSSEYDGEGDTPITVWGSIPVNTVSVSLNPTEITDVRTGKKIKVDEQRANITGVGIVGYDKNGNVVNGKSPEEVMRNPNTVRFDTRVLVQDKNNDSYAYGQSNIPVSSLSKPAQANLKKTINIQNKSVQSLNEALKKRPNTGSKGASQDNIWNSYSSNLFGTPSSNTTNKGKKITW